jgi:hypothetical protein
MTSMLAQNSRFLKKNVLESRLQARKSLGNPRSILADVR